MLGYLLLGVLTAYAFAAALSVSVRLRYPSRVETLLAAVLLWNFLILAPIHLLGVTNALDARSLAWSSIGVSSVALAASFLGVRPGAHAADFANALAGIVRLPYDALSSAARVRSLVLVGVVAIAFILPWTAWMTWLAPSDSWDGIWYHETIIGDVIQYHGYAMAPLPMTMTQQANGYPRNCEMTGLWFVIFTDRRLVELPSVLAAVPLVLSTYLIARRYSPDKVAAMGWACGLLLMPGALLELRSTYIDLHVAAFLLSALHFCTRPAMRIRDGWAAGFALALLIGSKSVALAWVPMLAAVAVVALAYRHGRKRPLGVISAALGGIVLILAVASVTYLHNWFVYKNPLWPIGYANPKYHIDWHGVQTLSGMAEREWNRPIDEIYKLTLTAPQPGKDYADTRVWGYGLAAPFLLVPLGALAFVVAILTAMHAVLLRLVGIPFDDEARATFGVVVVSLLLLAMGYISPALWQARYNLHLPAGMMFLAHWLGRRARRLSDGAAAVTIVTGLIMLYWAEPGWGMGIRRTLEYAKLPASQRLAEAPNEWTLAPEVALARERELGPGSVVVFTDDVTFPSLLWNEHYTNTVLYTPIAPPDEMLARYREVNADWVVVSQSGSMAGVLGSNNDFERVGLASRGYPTVAFRRRR